MRYALVIEKADGNYSAYVPDLPLRPRVFLSASCLLRNTPSTASTERIT